MRRQLFSGVATALVTPFKGGAVDYESMELLVERQIAAGVDALVFCGTTGEAPTLSTEEKESIFSFAVKTVNGRVPVICGTASNSHATSMKLSNAAVDAGADALLCVTPYYNKGTPDGIKRCYRDLCSLGVPVILYNIPSRSGVDIGGNILRELSDEENLIGIKECAGVSRISEYRANFSDRFVLYSGNDSEFLPSLSVGADGVVSVLSNLYPDKIKMIYVDYIRGNNYDAMKAHLGLSAISSLLFRETNPAPIKYALSRLKLCENTLRLPMSSIGLDLCKKIDDEMKKIEQKV